MWRFLKPYFDILRLVWPLALGMANNAVMQFADRVFLSHESAAALEAVLPASMLAFLFVGLFQSVVMYSGTFVAQYYGARDVRGQRLSFAAGLFLAFVSALIVPVFIPIGAWILTAVGHPLDVLVRERTYFAIVMLGGGALCAQMAASGYFTGRGQTRLVFWVNLAGNALNILLDGLLIFGCAIPLGCCTLTVPALGMAGAAWATVASQVLQALVLCTLAARETLGVSWRTLAAARGEFVRLAGRILRYGAPTGIHNLFNCLSFCVFLALAGRVEGIGAAVSSAAFAVNYLLYAPMEGFGIGAGVLVGQRMGAGDPAGAFRAGNRVIAISQLYIALASALVLIFSDSILMLFASDTAALNQTEFCRLGFSLFLLMTLWQFADAAEVVISGSLKGAGDTCFVMVWMLVMALPYWMPMLFITWHFCPTITALWWTMVVFCLTFALGTIVRWIWGPWRRIKLV